MKKFIHVSFLLLATQGFSTHLRAGYISVTPITCLEYRITIRAYVNTNPTETDVKFGGGILRFGDGNTHQPPIQNSVPQPGQSGVGLVEYSINYTYAAMGVYTISYGELNRNAGIQNMNESLNIAFYTETQIKIDPTTGCFQTPVILAPAVFTAPLNKTLNLSFAASSREDVLLQYDLIKPLTADAEGKVWSTPYTFPENVSINPFNGLLTWDTQYNGQFLDGEYAFAIQISQWKKKDDGTYTRLGHMIMDTQIILVDVGSFPSSFVSKDEIDENGRVYVPTTKTKNIKVIFSGFNPADIALNAYTELIDVPGAFSFTMYDSAANKKVGVLTLNSLAELDREEPYLITVRGNEKPSYYFSDITFMFYTRDVSPELITTTQESIPWSIYPNPATDKLTISMPPDKSLAVNLLDMQGKKIQSWGNTQTIDLTEFTQGLYIIEVRSTSGKRSFKLIKK